MIFPAPLAGTFHFNQVSAYLEMMLLGELVEGRLNGGIGDFGSGLAVVAQEHNVLSFMMVQAWTMTKCV